MIITPLRNQKRALPRSFQTLFTLHVLQFPHARCADILSLVRHNTLRIIAEYAGWCILFQNNGAAIHIDFKGVFFPDIQCASQFNGQNDPSQFVHFSDDTSRFQLRHILPAQRTPAIIFLFSIILVICPQCLLHYFPIFPTFDRFFLVRFDVFHFLESCTITNY